MSAFQRNALQSDGERRRRYATSAFQRNALQFARLRRVRHLTQVPSSGRESADLDDVAGGDGFGEAGGVAEEEGAVIVEADGLAVFFSIGGLED
jgi:hypothetical protein